VDAYKRLNEGDDSVLNEIDIPGNAKVVTVCAAGRTSQLASNALRKKGIEAYSLEGGMRSWSKSWNTAQMIFDNFEVLQIRRTGKGCLSYIISSNKEAIILDASLPVEVYQKLIKDRDLTVKYVIETHIHADHLSRSKDLAAYFHVPLYLPIRNKVAFLHNKILADTIFPIGFIKLTTIQTPGHTRESVCFYIENSIVFTGDTLFTNGVGRPDLKADEAESRAKTIQLYQSLNKLLFLPDEVIILPAHTDKPVEFDHAMISATIGQVKKSISLLQLDENDFVNALLQKIPPTPPNYLSIVEKNISGNFSEADSNELEAGANRCAVS
jgi:glyoxylase-like metal-dependent hydrolase (beta-lactamase superfamily II)